MATGRITARRCFT
jgi:hypothetical protein